MIDEAGNFDMQLASNPIYCLTLVFHDQNDCIDDQIDYFEKGLVSLGQDPRKAVHTSPLIRVFTEKCGICTCRILSEKRI